MSRNLFTLTLIGLLAVEPAAADDDCRYSEPRQEVLDVSGVERLRIDAAAGFLRIVGTEGISEVRVDGTACASREEYLDDIQLRIDRRGVDLLIEADMPDIDWGLNRSVGLNLSIEVPSTLALDVEDGSGSIEIRDVGPVVIDDGSGEIEIEGVNGDLRIEDGSGEIEIDVVVGNVTIEEDGSGGIRIHGVTGDVEIDEDGSGSISVRDVGGSVRIREDGSGSIRVVEVDGDFIVDRDGSGGISVDRVGGRVEIPDD